MNPENSERHNIVILSGLGDTIGGIERATSWWKFAGLTPHVLPVGWHDGVSDFQPKLDRITSLVDQLSQEGAVSIVGVSAGGSAAFNAYLERPDTIRRAVNVCGRLRAGKHNRRSLEKMSATSESFRHSVLQFEERELSISEDLRTRMMTVSARFGDEYVPTDTSGLKGAHNIRIPTVEHVLSISMALTFFAYPIIDFLRRDNA
jgi:pimeloyl-ACP methyl ester carboxylesterase